MSWCYEIRGSENRLVEVRRGFATEEEARDAGKRAKRVIDCICYPNLETLIVLTQEDDRALDLLAEMPPAEKRLAPERVAKRNVSVDLKYPWQQTVLDALLAAHPEDLPDKINAAERAISARLLDSAPFETDERIALGEALLALRRLAQELAQPKPESNDKEDLN